MSSANGTAQAARIDAHAARVAAADLLRALGADLAGDGVRDTPRRMVAAYSELLTPQPFNPTTFPNDEGYDERRAPHRSQQAGPRGGALLA